MAAMSASPVVAFASQKGGVGKSTLALGLAAHLADSGAKALLVDVDPQATAYDVSHAMTSSPGYEVAAETDPGMLEKLAAIDGRDMIIVDTPGSLEGRSVLATVIRHTDLIVIPYPHSTAAIGPTVRTAAYVREHGGRCAALVNNVDARLGRAFIHAAWATLDAAGVPYFRTSVRRYIAWEHAMSAGQTIMDYRGGQSASARSDLAQVAEEIRARVVS
jgi:chromosome partitioning protein